eukprot:g57617.t1
MFRTSHQPPDVLLSEFMELELNSLPLSQTARTQPASVPGVVIGSQRSISSFAGGPLNIFLVFFLLLGPANVLLHLPLLIGTRESRLKNRSLEISQVVKTNR